MLKLLIKALFLFAISVIIVLPIFGSFYGPKNALSHHALCVEKEKCGLEHLSHPAHNNSWNLIRNSQLSAPPHALKIKTIPIISLLYGVCCITLALLINRLNRGFSILQTTSLPVCEIYLVNKFLLI